jgi:tetratricopeptide (TPR) repeat protein
MAFLKKLFGKDPAALREDGEAQFKAGEFGSAKLTFQALVERLADGPAEQREAAQRRIADCQTELVRKQLAEVDRLKELGSFDAALELCRSTIEMADGLAIKAEVKAKADGLTEEFTRASQPESGAPSEEEVFLALSGHWSEEQAEELLSYGNEFRRAFLALHDGRAEEAREEFRKLSDEHPDALHIGLELARALVATRQRRPTTGTPSEDEAKAEAKAALEEAAVLLRHYLEHEPDDASDELYATVQSELAQVVLELGDAQTAEECLIEAADATHEQTYGHLNLGRFYRMQKRYDESIKRLELAVEKMGTVTPDIRVYRELGFAHRDAGHRDEAIDCLKAVIDHQASLSQFDYDPETAEALCALYLETGKNEHREEAANLYRHLARGRNVAGRFGYHLQAGKLLKALGKKAEGVRELHAARALAADDAARAEVDALLGGAPKG